jgi:hypothetical protein
VSFSRDVMPIFQLSCAFSTCHGSSTRRVQLVGDAQAVHAAIVAVPAGEAPTLSYVAPGDLAKSYLMHKVDGDLCTVANECTGGNCEATMPQGSPLMPIANRDIIRRWIAQGAKAD